MSSKKDKCVWCKYNPYSPDCDKEGTCDFKTLPYEKSAIVDRLKGESRAIARLKDSLVKGRFDGDPENVLSELVDVSKGMQIMVDRLHADFGMPLADIEREIGFQKQGVIDKARIYSKLMKLRRKRGKKNASGKSN